MAALVSSIRMVVLVPVEVLPPDVLPDVEPDVPLPDVVEPDVPLPDVDVPLPDVDAMTVSAPEPLLAA